MTRCIHCTRCVRFLEEIAGTSEMGGTGRGDRTEIGTCIEKSIDSELSGNVIDLCPVGALTNKPFRFSARAWELLARPAQAAHDAVCSDLYYHQRRGRILRAVPRHNEARNETWLSDRDRYSHFGLYAEDRAQDPRVRIDGELRTVSWEDGIAAAAAALRKAGDSLNVLMGGSSPTEEYFLAQRLARALGSQHVDHRLREQDCSDDAARATCPRFEMPVAALQEADAVLLVGSNVRQEAPILGHRLRKAWRAGGRIMAINPVDWPFHFTLSRKAVVAPRQMAGELAAVAAALAEQSGQAVPEALAAYTGAARPDENHAAMARTLLEAGRGVVLVGQFAHSHPRAAALRQLAAWIAGTSGSALNLLPFGGNPVGAWLAGAVPHRGPGGKVAGPGRSAADMMGAGGGSFLLWDFEPGQDAGNPAALARTLAAAEQVVAVTPFLSKELEAIADVILPLAPLAESEGSLHDIDGAVAPVHPAGQVSGDCKPGWKILRRLGAELGLEGFSQVSLADLQAEMNEALAGQAEPGSWHGQATDMPAGLERVGEVPMYAVDALCRRSGALQQTRHADAAYLGLNPADSAELGLPEGAIAAVSQEGACVELPVRVLATLPRGAAWLAGATAAAAELGALVGPLSVEKA